MSLEDKKITNFSKPVSAMPDVPGAAGYTAAQVKEWFDSNSSVEIKNSINSIIDFLLGFTNSEEIKGIRVNEDDVLEVTKDGANYIDTGYSKAYIIQMLSQKVDKSDVLLKTNTEEFTPTGIYQPATKKYVDDKVVSAGAADMTQAVYDPTGRQTDIFAEVDKKFDKKGGAIDGDVEISGDLDLIGGIAEIDRVNINRQLQLENNSALMLYAETGDNAQISKDTYYEEEDHGLVFIDNSGSNQAYLRVCASEAQVIAETTNLNVKARYPHFLLTNEGYNRNLDVFFMTGTGAPDGGILVFRNNLNSDNSTTLYIHPEFTTAPNNLIRCQIKKDGRSTYSNIFGQHNKPSNKYTGNGSSTAREIAIGGIGNAVMITSVNGMCIVTAAGAICKTTTGTSVSGLGDTSIKFVNGVLTIATTNVSVNSANVDYNYQLL